MRWLALFLVACGDPSEVHTPNIADPTCFRTVVDIVTAGSDECVRLEAQNVATEFTLDGSACGGTPCLLLHPGESGYVSTAVDRANHYASHGSCDVVRPCP